MLKKDWILDQIEDLTESVAKIFLNEPSPEYIPEKVPNSSSDKLYNELNSLISEKKINDAENLLFEKIDIKNIKHLAVAIDFYSKLNKFSDQDLEKANYSRQEISEGLDDILNKFGIKMTL